MESALLPIPTYKVLLRPSVEIALRRNAERRNKNFDTNVLRDVISSIYNAHNLGAYQAANWLILDSSALSVNETVQRILSHFKQTNRLD